MTENPQYGTPEWFEKMFTTAGEGIDGWGHQWRASQQFRYSLCLSVVSDLISEQPPQEILDIGCGLGDFTNMVFSLNPKNKLYGMDISQNAVLGAKQKYPHIEFRQQTLPQIGYENKFDGIISLDCLCYLDDSNRRDTAKNIQMQLKSKGWFVFSTPIDDGSRYFSTRQVFKMLEGEGFKTQKITYNNARLYKGIEIFFLNVRDLSIILQVAENDSYDKLTPNKKKLYHLIEIPLLGTLLKVTIKLSNYFAGRILKSLYIVRFFQWISQTFLANWGISHLIVLSFKNE